MFEYEKVCSIFMHLKEVYDKVNRFKSWDILHEYGKCVVIKCGKNDT